MTIDRHHAVLYGAAFVIFLALAGVYHQWRLDLATAQIKAAAQDQVIAAADKRDADRQKAFDAQLAQLQGLRVTGKTPAPIIVTRLAQLEPSMNVLPDQLVAPKPDAPKVNLVLDPAQQVTLVNRLIDCRECEAERLKLRGETAEWSNKFDAMTRERDTFKTAAKGGSLMQRVKRRFWHFIEDAIIIEGARCASGKC